MTKDFGEKVRSFLTLYGRNKLAENAGWMLIGRAVCLVIQMAYFILIARSLGPSEYGAFAAVVALVSILYSFVGLGTPNLLLKNVARDRSVFGEYWGQGLLITFGSGLVAMAVTLSLCRLTLPRSIALQVVFAVSIADLICGRCVELAGTAFQACERLGMTAQMSGMLSVARLVGIAAVWRFRPHPTATQWSWVYALASAAAGVCAVRLATTKLGAPRLCWSRLGGERMEGLSFCVGTSAQTIYNDVDKLMLARLGSLGAAGIYAAAYRVINTAFVPVHSLVSAALPGLFSRGEGGINQAYGYAKRLLARAAVYSAVASVALFICAPVTALIFGREYADAVPVIRWLALLPLLRTVHYFMAESLACSGYQPVRMCIQVLVAIGNVVANLWLIPAYSWRGAAWSSVASDGLLAVALWVSILYLRSESVRPRAIPVRGRLAPELEGITYAQEQTGAPAPLVELARPAAR